MAPRVTLRDFRPADAVAVERWFNDSRVTENLLEQRSAFSAADARRWVERAMDTSGEDRKWAVVVEGRPEAVGFTALYGLGRQIAPEIGAVIGDPEVWGRGIGTECERATLVRAFTEFGAHRVYGRMPATNDASRRVLMRLGFKREGLLRRHIRRGTRFIDVELWGILPDELTGWHRGGP